MDRTQKLSMMKTALHELKKIVSHQAVQDAVPQALRAYEYIEKKGNVMVTQDVEKLGRKRCTTNRKLEQRYLTLCALCQSDAQHHPIWKKHFETIDIAGYFPGTHTIYVKLPFLETSRFMAFRILHEVGRAIFADQDERSWVRHSAQISVEKLLEQETSLYATELDLCRILGGQVYRDGLLKGAINQIYGTRWDYSGYGRMLDEILGEPPSNEAAKTNRDRMYTNHVAFTTCELIVPQGDEFALKQARKKILESHSIEM